MNKIQVFPISVDSNSKLEKDLNDFLDMIHRHEHRLIDIKYSVTQGPLSEGDSRQLHAALVIYEEKGNHADNPRSKAVSER